MGGWTQVRNRDQYGRGVASCSLPGSGGDLGAWLVNNGLAVAYRRAPLQDACRVEGLGLAATRVAGWLTRAWLSCTGIPPAGPRLGNDLRALLAKQWPGRFAVLVGSRCM